MRVLSLTPWRRGPVLLLRRPGVFLALAAAAFVAALPAASAPLFLSSARNATLHNQLAIGCPWTAGAGTSVGAAALRRDGSLGSTAETIAGQRELAVAATPVGLTAPMSTVWSHSTLTVAVAGRADARAQVRLVGRDDVAGHVQVRAGGPGRGLWLPHQLAEALGVQPGQQIDVVEGLRPLGAPIAPGFDPGPPRTARFPVTAVYTDLRTVPDDPYWCGVRDVYRGFPGQELTDVPLFDMVLLDTGSYLELTTEIGRPFSAHTLEWAIADLDRMRFEQAVELRDGVVALEQKLRGEPRLFRHLAAQPRSQTGTLPEGVGSRVDRATRRAGFVHSGLLPPVAPITGAGVLVGLLVVAAAAVFWVQRRQRELAVLAAHGVSPAALGGKGVLESLPALLLGSAAGAAVGWTLVRELGPDPVLSADAPRQAAIGLVGTLVLAGLVIGVAAGLRSRALTDQTGRRHGVGRLAALPWELLLFVAAVLAWRSLDGSRQFVDASGAGTIAIVPARLLVVPILVVAGLVVLSGRIGVRLARWRQYRVPAGLRPARLLARRRLFRHATIAAVLAGATAVPVALATYGAIVTDTVQSTVEGESTLQVGSDIVVTLAEPAPVPAALAGRATAVTRLSQVSVEGVRGDVLVVDPETFTEAAFWHGSIAGPDLDELTERLRGGVGVGSGVLPSGAVEVNWGPDPIARLTIEATRLLPGGRGGFPVLLADRSSFSPQTLAEGSPEIWVRGDEQAALRALADAGVPIARYFSASERFANTTFEPLTFTFSYLAALSLLTGLVSLVGLLLYLESRTPTMRRGYVLLRRMGLRPGAHRRALLAELAIPLLLGLFGGLVMVAGLTVAVRRELELDPGTPPGPLITLPLPAVGGTAVAVVLVALFATLFAHARTSRAAPSEVLRDAN